MVTAHARARTARRDQLQRVTDAVRLLSDHGIYTVVSLHSDRYAADLGTGTEFDGAPRWAVETGGRPCGDPGPRYYTPCAAAAARRFYSDATVGGRGLIDWYADTAAALAAAGAAGGPGYAGLDLINEPTDPWAATPERPSARWRAQLAELLRRVSGRVRDRVPVGLLWVQPQGPRGTEPARPTALPTRLGSGIVYAPMPTSTPSALSRVRRRRRACASSTPHSPARPAPAVRR